MRKESERTTTVRESYAETVGCRGRLHSRGLTCTLARPPLAIRGGSHWQASGSIRLLFADTRPGPERSAVSRIMAASRRTASTRSRGRSATRRGSPRLIRLKRSPPRSPGCAQRTGPDNLRDGFLANRVAATKKSAADLGSSCQHRSRRLQPNSNRNPTELQRRWACERERAGRRP
jgi:hypothetical protein